MDDSGEDIMRATYGALCDHGYADLTMRDIAEESELSKAALHYHYESKRGLMLAFLDYLYDGFTDRVGGADPDARPDEQLRTFLSAVLHPPGEDETRDFRTALLEIKAQAPYDEAFRERLAAFDEHVADTVVELVRLGIEDGTYRADADPQEVAEFVLVVVNGAQSRHVVAGESVDVALAALESYLDAHLREVER